MLPFRADRPFDHLVCDLDGTLVDSAPGILAAIRTAVGAVFPAWDGHYGPELIGPPVREMFHGLLGPLASDRLDDLLAHFRSAYDAHGIQNSRVYDGVAETLADLHGRGVHCYVLTQKPTAPTRRMLAHHGLGPYFRDTLSPDDPHEPYAKKPDGAKILVRRHRLPAGRTALVGDSEDDRVAAEACELTFHAAGYGYGGARSSHGRALARFDEILHFAEPVR